MHTLLNNVLLLFFLNMVLKAFLQQDTRRTSAPFRVEQSLNPYHIPLQDGIRFFRHLKLAPPTVCLAVHLPDYIRRRYEVPTFHIIDPMSDLGAPWTPVVLQFRAGTLETCNLTTRYSHRGIAFELLTSVGLSPLDDAWGHSIIFTISLVPSP